MIQIKLSERDFDYEIQALVSSFFPGSTCQVIIEGEENLEKADLTISIRMQQKSIEISIGSAESIGAVRNWSCPISGTDDFHKHEGKTAHPYRTEYKNILKKGLFCLLRDFPEDSLPASVVKRVPVWGTMTGVRPTKIPMNEILAGKTRAQVEQSLLEEYQCSQEKATLCMNIAETEAELLEQAHYQDGYSLYIGIPFCPTTCLYCSFTSYPVGQFGSLIPEYLEALKKEIRHTGAQCKGHTLTSVYIGGGTPTTLSPEQLRDLIQTVKANFPMEQVCEFTVEAGRPDSITREKLEALAAEGVERISVNSQTMQQKTLDLIGRRHTVEDTREIFKMAREMGFTNINMDLIIGLPGETVADFEDTLHQVEQLDPDCLTIHSLVIKRASRLRRVMEEGKMREEERAQAMEQMLVLGEQYAAAHGYLPYYMYRQKNSSGHGGSSGQENIGYSKPGKECLYNILIMEEKQSILALGAGASTKKFDPKKNLVSRIENVKSVTDYIQRIDEMLARKGAGIFE